MSKARWARASDLLGIDEATHFAESQIRFLMGWNRTDDPNQRVAWCSPRTRR
jgi:hypothetical protein